MQQSSVLGPFSGGLEFSPNFSLSRVREQAVEQMLQNSLTGMRLGGARGGADFDPNGKSPNEIKTFCRNFIMELSRFIGPEEDVPCGGVGVGEREIGYMYGRYKRMMRRYDGALAGEIISNDLAPDVTLNRERSTGLGAVLLAQRELSSHGKSLEGARCVISGSGHVALATARALVDAGAKPVTLSDTSGYIYEPDGFTVEDLAAIERITQLSPYGDHRSRLSQYVSVSSTCKYISRKSVAGRAQDDGKTDAANDNVSVWSIPCDYGFPCASANELSLQRTKAAIKGGCKGIFEVAMHACTSKSVDTIRKEKQDNFTFVPAKLASAGGCIITGVTMARTTNNNTGGVVGETSQRELFDALNAGIERAYDEVKVACDVYGVDLHDGVNIAAFSRISNAMRNQGYI